jgi:hypothetical protein
MNLYLVDFEAKIYSPDIPAISARCCSADQKGRKEEGKDIRMRTFTTMIF